MITVGLTGGFASGKTTVARMFQARGAKFISADAIVHRLLKGRGRCARRVVRVFGRGILSQGQIDRRKLAGVVFHDPVQRKMLEGIIHPEVIREIKKEVKAHKNVHRKKVLMIEVPLLFEAGLERIFDYTLTVFATRPQQIRRALQTRSLTRQEIQNRIKSQLPLAVKRRLADILIDNRGSLSYTKRQTSEAWHTLTRTKE